MSAITIALLGRTGNGKSATGNTIPRKIFFKESSHMTSCSKLVKDGDNRIDGYDVTVYDTPGPHDLEETEELMKKKAVEHCNAIMYACTKSGVNVFVFVLNYSNSFSKEEASTVKIYETILGAEFLKTHGILVFTHGDNFDPHEDGDFQIWCHRQTGEMKKLMDKFAGNVILISNKGPFDWTRGQHGSKLLHLCLAKKKIRGPYTVTDYNKNESNRRKLIGSSSCFIF